MIEAKTLLECKAAMREGKRLTWQDGGNVCLADLNDIAERVEPTEPLPPDVCVYIGDHY